MVRHMKNASIFAIVIVLLTSGSLWAKTSDNKTIINAVSKEKVNFLKSVEEKYQKQHGIIVELQKKVRIEALDSETTSSGAAWFLKGKMKLEIQEPIPSKIIADGRYLWLVSPAPKEFKGAKTQVAQASLNSPRARSQGLIQLLTQGGLLKYFKPVGVKTEKNKILFFLQPKKQSAEFKRAQLTVNSKTKVITALHYWDRNDSETVFMFTKTLFNQALSSSLFDYQPPKDAEITTL